MAVIDLRPQLNERLNINEVKDKALQTEYETEKKALEAKFSGDREVLRQERDLLLAMLEHENQRLGDPPKTTNQPRAALDDFFVDALMQMGPQWKDDLHKLAAVNGCLPAGADARTTHVTLLNVLRGGRIRKLDDGRYAATQAEEQMRDLLQ